ncbi:putative enoyl CoA hydratase [Irineochytrium annulatum]|nr:putative enoyl CoA hydratase [Irineochytrium annulatum]
MTAFETLRVTVDNAVCHVELNRPRKLNAMNPKFWEEMRVCFEELKKDMSVRAIVISGGDAKGFTGGLDLSESFMAGFEGDPARAAIRFLPLVESMQASFTSIEKCGKPVIAAVHGPCIGGGIDLITACDVRICTSDALFSVKEVDIGLAADVGTLQRLPKVVGNQSWVRDICMSARNFGAAEALKFGLVSQIVSSKAEAVDEALKWARAVAAKSPIAVHGTKHILNYSRDHTVDEGLHYVAVWNSVMLNTQDLGIALSAAAQKQKPIFPKL